MNKVVLIGRLTKDPELRKTPTDLSVCQFTIAVNREYSKNEEQQTDFINCVAWRNQADNLCKYQHKGNLIAVDGSIQVRTYDNDKGIKKYVTEVVANHIDFIEKKEQAPAPTPYEKASANYQNQKQQFNNQFENVQAKNDISADDLPF